jgi:hypothetical protein
MSLNEELDMLRKIRLFSMVEPAKLKARGLHQRAGSVRGEALCSISD